MRQVDLGLGDSSDRVPCAQQAETICGPPTIRHPERTEIRPVTRAGQVLVTRVLAGEPGG